MSSSLQTNKRFLSTVRKLYLKHKKELIDVILFGSVTRGKRMPKDVDILLLFSEKEDIEITYTFRKAIEKLGIDVHIVTKTYDGLFAKGFKARSAIFTEGFSLIRRESISDSLGFMNLMIFKYQLKGFSQSQRMKLQYALYGRDKKSGIVSRLHLQKFASAVFLCPMEHVEELEEFFSAWGIPIKTFPVLFAQRTR